MDIRFFHAYGAKGVGWFQIHVIAGGTGGYPDAVYIKQAHQRFSLHTAKAHAENAGQSVFSCNVGAD